MARVKQLLYLMMMVAFVHSYAQDVMLDSSSQAYIYAYPLVLTDVSMRAMIQKGAQINQFTHLRQLPTDEFRTIVRPNIDTLYSNAWIDLSQGPIVLSLPDTHGRYYLIQIMDAWTNVFASLGKRTTGTKALNVLLVGPSWNGNAPKKMKVVHAPTNIIWILGRTQTNGKKDYDFVRKIQDGYMLTPLRCWHKKCDDAVQDNDVIVDTTVSPEAQVAEMGAQEFYAIFAQALKKNRPAKADRAMIAQLKKIGIFVGQSFDVSQISDDLLDVLNKGMKLGRKKIADAAGKLGKMVNGWDIFYDIGTYGTNYLMRALIAHLGVGANLPQDALYPTAFVDGDGNILNGKNKYVIHFDKKNIPPVNAFWSITLYDEKSYLVPNEINRFGLGDRDSLTFNKDGSLDIYIQSAAPEEDKQANWLPAPEGVFNLSMRLYWPKKSALKGVWVPPAIIIQ